MLAATALAVFAAADAKAAYYKTVICSDRSGAPPFATATNTRSSKYPNGIFHLWDFCDPPGGNAMLRIQEHKWGGEAGHTAYGYIYLDAPAGLHFKSVGVATRQPDYFNSGWRARVWVASACCASQIFLIGKGLSDDGGQGDRSHSFVWRPWPLESLYTFNRVFFEMNCVKSSGCSTDGVNTTDFRELTFVLDDERDARASFTDTGADLLAGRWVRGTHHVGFEASDRGSGIRREQLRIDGAEHWARNHSCRTASSARHGEWARTFHPCGEGPHRRSMRLESGDLPDGAHSVEACAQDFGQYQGLYGTGGESCTKRTIRTDNTAPGKPAGLEVTSADPERYLPEVGARFDLPPDPGSPIRKVHYELIDSSGDAIGAERVLRATNPTEIAEIRGPRDPGAYRLRVWLEDEVGHVGPAAIAKVPRDDKPPASPQRLSAASPDTPRSRRGFDVRWGNITDDGSPIVAAHYQVRDGSGRVVVPTETARGNDIRSIASIDTPREPGRYTLRLWLSDTEGNTGAPSSVPLAYECVRSSRAGGRLLSATLDGHPAKTVAQGEAATLRGELRDKSGGLRGAPLCVFSQVEGSEERQFLGIALTGTGGAYRFVAGPGPSRRLSAVYRPGQRRLSAGATLRTQVKPTLQAAKQVVRTGEAVHLYGQIPGPRNDDVVVVLQVKQGEGWLAFRRYRTRGGGRFEASYLFRRTTRPTTYEFRAQVRESGGYPYLEGDSDPLQLRVLPKQVAANRCRAAQRRARGARAKRRAKKRCQRALARKRCAKVRRASRRHPQAKRLRRRARKACARYRRLRQGKRRSGSQRPGKAQGRRQGRGR